MALEKWKIDTIHSSVNFSIRHLMVSKVHGKFAKWSGTVEFDEQNPSASQIAAQIEVSSIDTGEPQRDGHLRSADFFEVEKYPQMTFRSTKVEAAGDGAFKVTGDLSMHGVTKSVVLDAEFAGRAKNPRTGTAHAGFSAHTSLNRKDFGLNFNVAMDAGGVMVGDKVEISIEIETAAA